MIAAARRDYRVICLSRASSPITHMRGVEGNEAMVARAPIATPTGVRRVPYLSGNSLRHSAVRAPGMAWLVGELGLAGSLTVAQLNFLFHGGAMTRGGGKENIRRVADFHRLWPLGRLLGGSFPDQMVAGTLIAGRGILACEENRDRLACLLDGAGPEILPDRMRPAESFVGDWRYHRMDARGGWIAADNAEAADSDSPDKSAGMIMSGQCVIPGSIFVHEFVARDASEAEVGALLWSIDLWRSGGGLIGGSARIGHGRLDVAILDDGGDHAAMVGAYLDHVRPVRDEAVGLLREIFAAPADEGPAKKPARGKKGEAPTASASIAAGGDRGPGGMEPQPIAAGDQASLFGDS